MARDVPGQSQETRAFSGSATLGQGSKQLVHLLLFSQVHEQGAVLEVDHLGLELAPISEDGISLAV